MSNKIAFFFNLPTGGGLKMIEEIIDRYSDKFQIDIYIAGEKKYFKKNKNVSFFEIKTWKGFLLRNLFIIFVLPKIHKKIAFKINKIDYKFIFFSHDYFTKSPYLLRYVRSKKIYLCQEPQREYYESQKIHANTIKEKIANIIRYPIKLIDEKNLQYVDLLLSNSKYSQKTLKKVYKKIQLLFIQVLIQNFSAQAEIRKNNYFVSGD